MGRNTLKDDFEQGNEMEGRAEEITPVTYVTVVRWLARMLLNFEVQSLIPISQNYCFNKRLN